jgi:hypothetical protein
MPYLLPGHPTPYGDDRKACPRCERSSYSYASFDWCPWCDKAAPDPSPPRTQMIGDVEFMVGL